MSTLIRFKVREGFSPHTQGNGTEVIPLSRSEIADIVNRAVSDKPISAEEVVQLADMANGFLVLYSETPLTPVVTFTDPRETAHA